jgi:hypothetical protein
MKTRFTLFVVVVSYVCVLTAACSDRSEPAESTATDFSGFWKASCTDAFGVQIKKQPGNLFSVSFCGPGGCFEPGKWMPNTPILGDHKYQLTNPKTLAIQHGGSWQTFTKCTTNTDPVLEYSTMPAESPSATQQGSAHVFRPNLGLPDYIHKSPFKANASAVEMLKKQLALVVTSTTPCKVGEVDVADLSKTRLFTNICDKAQSDALRKLIPELAPDLTSSTTTVWKATSSSGEGDVLVTHIDISTEENFRYPYLSLWRISFKDGRVDAQFGGSFLAGEIHAIRPFGHEDKANKVFVKHLSCIECEPWVYLTILDFSRQTATPVKFTYAEDHKDYDDTIEYELPGMGHSVDAKVETRTPKNDAGQLADLIQAFRYTEGKKTEWWIFSCKNGHCDYRMFNGTLPEKYRSSWASADKL